MVTDKDKILFSIKNLASLVLPQDPRPAIPTATACKSWHVHGRPGWRMVCRQMSSSAPPSGCLQDLCSRLVTSTNEPPRLEPRLALVALSQLGLAATSIASWASCGQHQWAVAECVGPCSKSEKVTILHTSGQTTFRGDSGVRPPVNMPRGFGGGWQPPPEEVGPLDSSDPPPPLIHNGC